MGQLFLYADWLDWIESPFVRREIGVDPDFYGCLAAARTDGSLDGVVCQIVDGETNEAVANGDRLLALSHTLGFSAAWFVGQLRPLVETWERRQSPVEAAR